MIQTLFRTSEYPKFLLDITFAGPSFDGMMEIDALAKEIQGLEDLLKIALHSLKKNGKIELKISDIEIYVEAFEKGSFRKKIKVFNRATKEYMPLIQLAGIVILVFQIIPQYTTHEIKNPSADFISSIRDQVALELLQDPKFLSATANIVGSVSVRGDMCTLTSASNECVIIDHEASPKFTALASSSVEQIEDGEHNEILRGRINRVDLDASRRHIGFKVNNEGTTVDGTFDQMPSVSELKNLLDQWVEIKGTVFYLGGQRNHMDVHEYKLIRQAQLKFENKNIE